MIIDAYFDEWSCLPGDKVRMAVSTDAGEIEARLVRLIGGPGKPGERRVQAEEVRTFEARKFAGRLQQTNVGSYARLPISVPAAVHPVIVHCRIWATRPDCERPQTVWSLQTEGDPVCLHIESRRLHLVMGTRILASVDEPLAAARWYSIVVAVSADECLIDAYTPTLLTETSRYRQRADGIHVEHIGALYLATTPASGGSMPKRSFDGKVDSPRIYRGDIDLGVAAALHADSPTSLEIVAEWGITEHHASDVLPAQTSSCSDGVLYNGVERGVTGYRWNGTTDQFSAAPDHYSALQFHSDAVMDAGWEYDFEFDLPEDLRSGIYAIRLSAGTQVEHYPLFVGPKKPQCSDILFLVPTNTYLAYANDHLAALDLSAVMSHPVVVPEYEQRLPSEPGLGRSLYDTHSDGTPVRMVSRRRPLLNVRPDAVSWVTGSYRHFPVDLYAVEWLEKIRAEYAVSTDDDLDEAGFELLSRHKVVITGSHPEYWTSPARDALERYLAQGGKLMYLGGNGFYWVTSRHPDRPWQIEVRRDNTGTRSWDAPPGERVHATNGEIGGIWRQRGKAPNRLVGIGFSAQGWSPCGGYHRHRASYDTEASQFFEGIDADVVGDRGYVLEGAVGDEVDRFDIVRGSPPHAVVLASSAPLGPEYQLVIEDQTLILPGQDGPRRPDVVRADMVYARLAGGGEIFSVGSIAYLGAVAWNDFDNPLARLTTNVVRRFLAGTITR